AVAGALVTPFFYVAPDVGESFNIMAFVVVVLGGMGNFVGALVGGIIVGVAESLGAALLPGSLKQLVVFAIFVLALLFRPQWLFGGAGGGWGRGGAAPRAGRRARLGGGAGGVGGCAAAPAPLLPRDPDQRAVRRLSRRLVEHPGRLR